MFVLRGWEGDFFRAQEDDLSLGFAGGHHFVGTGRGASDAQYGIAMVDQLHGYGMEDLIENGIACLFAAGCFEQGKGKPFAQYGQMPHPVDLQGGIGHVLNIGSNENRIIVGTGTVWAGYQYQKGLLCHSIKLMTVNVTEVSLGLPEKRLKQQHY